MARVSFKYNIFKNQGYKNSSRNCSAPIRFMEYPNGKPVCGTFEQYMDEVDAHPELFNFSPLVFEITGFLACGNLERTCKDLATRKCMGLNDFLDGKTISLKRNVFSIQSYGDLFPDKESAQRCITRMMEKQSPYFYFEPNFDGLYPQNVEVDQASVKVLSFTKEKRLGKEVVLFQVRFDMNVCLKEPVESLDSNLLKEPYCWRGNGQDFYKLARLLNDNVDHFYFVDHLNAVMYKNASEEDSDKTFMLEFKHQMTKYSVADYAKVLYSLITSSEWREKLEFWSDSEKFDFSRASDLFVRKGAAVFFYEVPNRTCSNMLKLYVSWHMDDKLMSNIKKFYELVEKKTIEMVYNRMPYAFDVGYSTFMARIRDVRTIQDMETHCFHIYNAFKNLYDYLQQEVLDKGEDFLQHIARLVLERVKTDPLDFMDDENDCIKKMATARLNGSYFGE